MQIPSASPIIAALHRASSQNINSQPSSPTPSQTLSIQNPSQMLSLLGVEPAPVKATLTPRVCKRALQQVVPKRDRKVVVKWMQAQAESPVTVIGLMARAVRHFPGFFAGNEREMSLKRRSGRKIGIIFYAKKNMPMSHIALRKRSKDILREVHWLSRDVEKFCSRFGRGEDENW